ncbi:hypothetical protein GZL_06834 [Streptomyces sp. 769]|nr:hypothetical protein GZL_06834 [Streptomyces sp. 769]
MRHGRGRAGGRCQERGTQGEQGCRGGGPEPSGTSLHSCSSRGSRCSWRARGRWAGRYRRLLMTGR